MIRVGLGMLNNDSKSKRGRVGYDVSCCWMGVYMMANKGATAYESKLLLDGQSFAAASA